MSNYKFYAKDFPKRCGKLYEQLKKKTESSELDVSFMMIIATSAVTIPLERLSKEAQVSSSQESDYLSKERFNSFISGKTSIGQVYEGDSGFKWGTTWEYYEETIDGSNGQRKDTLKHIDLSEKCAQAKKTDKLIKVINSELMNKDVLWVIRHALAHGNVCTDGNPIDELYLATYRGNDSKFKLLHVSVADFRDFLDCWFSLLKEVHLPEEIIPSEDEKVNE